MGRAGYEASMKRLAQHCFTRHAAMWAGMNIRQQMEWSHRAHRHASERKAEMAAQWNTLHDELANWEKEHRELQG